MSVEQPAVRKRQRGPNDPDRPGRIARSAIGVIAEQGIEALTHRKVAAAAGVPLGSTTYYFASRDDLIAAALAEAADRSVAALRTWDAGLPDGVDLVQALADFVVASITEQREHTVAEYHLYAVAMHRPHLRKAAADWDAALAEVFIGRTDEVTGQLIATLTCGLLMQAVLSDQAPPRPELVALFERALSAPTSAGVPDARSGQQ